MPDRDLQLVRPSVIVSGAQIFPVPVQIEYAARVCTGSIDKLSHDVSEANEFCHRLMMRGHHTPFEQATLTWALPSDGLNVERLLKAKTPYIEVTCQGGVLYVTGSPRAIFENWQADRSGLVSCALQAELRQIFPFLPGPIQDPHLVVPRLVTDLSELGTARFKHERVSLLFEVSRAVSHELVRHRTMSVQQRSQRYTRRVTVIEPVGLPHLEESGRCRDLWLTGVRQAISAYEALLAEGARPEEARRVLPNSTATTVLMTGTVQQWQGLCSLRCSPACDPEMQLVAEQARDLIDSVIRRA